MLKRIFNQMSKLVEKKRYNSAMQMQCFCQPILAKLESEGSEFRAK